MSELERSMPGLAMVAVRRVGIERRRGNKEAVGSMYTRLISEADSAEVRSFYTIKYARYQAKVNSSIHSRVSIDVTIKQSTNRSHTVSIA
jgi:hypothetical protein